MFIDLFQMISECLFKSGNFEDGVVFSSFLLTLSAEVKTSSCRKQELRLSQSIFKRIKDFLIICGMKMLNDQTYKE